MRCRFRTNVVAAAVVAVVASAGWGAIAPAWAAGKRVLVANDSAYVKECGACHMPFSPELLPARSWRKVMGNLNDHFGDTATLDAPTQQRITDYLAANAAERATNDESVQVMRSLRDNDAPTRITEVPYIAALHTAALDPRRGGNPRPKTLAECGVCHQYVQVGNYWDRRYSVTDVAFR